MMRRAFSQFSTFGRMAIATLTESEVALANYSQNVTKSNYFKTEELQFQLQRFCRHYSSVVYPTSKVELLKPAPDFKAPAVVDGEFKEIQLSSYKGKYVLLFFYPKDFTYVCPTEIIAFSDRAPEFEKLGCQVMAVSTDTEETHLAWVKTPRKEGGLGYMQIPLVADTTKEISAEYGTLLKEAGIAFRGLFIIDREGVVQQITLNNLNIGRSVDEALRLIQAQQFYEENGQVCPANWQPGEEGMGATPDTSQAYFQQQAEYDQKVTASKVRVIADAADFEATINKAPVVVDFMAPWCGKCNMIAPYVEGLAEKYPNLEIVKVDTTQENLKPTVENQALKGLPVFKFFKGGKEVADAVVGYKKGPLADAVEKLSKQT